MQKHEKYEQPRLFKSTFNSLLDSISEIYQLLANPRKLADLCLSQEQAESKPFQSNHPILVTVDSLGSSQSAESDKDTQAGIAAHREEKTENQWSRAQAALDASDTPDDALRQTH